MKKDTHEKELWRCTEWLQWIWCSDIVDRCLLLCHRYNIKQY